MPPGYLVSSSFWLNSVSDLRDVTGKCASRAESYRMTSGMVSACRAISARSYAETCWPGASSPFGSFASTSYACSWCASAFISATPLPSEPVACARAIAASFAEISSSA